MTAKKPLTRNMTGRGELEVQLASSDLSDGPFVANPMNALGDTIIGGAAGALVDLAGNPYTTMKYLASQGNGANAQAQTWQPSQVSAHVHSGDSQTIQVEHQQLILGFDQIDGAKTVNGAEIVLNLASSPLWGLSWETAVSSAVSATPMAMHKCSGTSYSISLPAVKSCPGQVIGFRMMSSLAGLVTLAAASTDLIDGASSRIMWEHEVAILWNDGVSWTKIAGKSIPMIASLGMSGNQTFSASTPTKLTFSVVQKNACPTVMLSDSASAQIDIIRSGYYSLTGRGYTNSSNTTSSLSQLYIAKNGAEAIDTESYIYGSNQLGLCAKGTLQLAVGDTIALYGNYYNGSYTTSYLFNDSGGASPWNELIVEEICRW